MKYLDFIDYVDDNQGISIKDVRISSIIKVTGEIYIPEQFDMVHLIDQYKDMIVSQVDHEDNNQRELINSVLKNSKVKIPIFWELGGWLWLLDGNRESITRRYGNWL